MDLNDAQNEAGVNPENNQNDQNNMASLLENEGLGIDFPTQGEIRKGVIASITPGQILVSVGTKSEGVITGKEYELIPSDELVNLKIGQEIPVFVVNPEDSDGNLILSYMRAREEEGWQVVETLLANKTCLPQHCHWIQQGRFDRSSWRFARFCSRLPDQPHPPRRCHRRYPRTALGQNDRTGN